MKIWPSCRATVVLQSLKPSLLGRQAEPEKKGGRNRSSEMQIVEYREKESDAQSQVLG